jgi:hypothetical protein
MPLQLQDKSDFIPELTINTQHPQAESAQSLVLFSPKPLERSPRSEPWFFNFSRLQSSNGGSRPSSQGKSHPFQAHSALPFSNSTSILPFHPFLFLIGLTCWNFDSCRRPNSIVLPRPRRSFRSSWAHWSWIPKDPLQGSTVETSWVVGQFQELAFAPNRRLEKLV